MTKTQHAVLCAILIVSIGGCRERTPPAAKVSPSEAQNPAPVDPRGPAAPPVRNAPFGARHNQRRKMAPIELDEVANLLAVPPAARVLEAPHKDPIPRVEGSWCLDGTDLGQVATSITSSLTGAGWPDVKSVPRPLDTPTRYNFIAHKDAFALSGYIARGEYPNCNGASDVYLTIGVHKIMTAPADPADGPPAPGTTVGPPGARISPGVVPQ